ncbi:hypothetical protein PR202_gb09496 [Eleusine coracana subsp. coracana]|uniref:Phosphatidic acid phosphatase type 2/haloperoxidase domain-containing protein n=1 Tax=Eleusine coracana subsp. coracana TaxID=191504 RepID=A0AAV5EHK2_ELECO|nr:hypothetical protein PR202_gb09496 [Eleusine coracana subsp. coracana]
MTCLLFATSSPRSYLSAPVSQRPHCKDRFLSPRVHQRPRLRLGVRMVEMARIGAGASPEVGVPGEGDAMLGVEESPGGRRKVARWSSVETTLNRMSKWLVSACFSFAALWKHDVEIMWILLGAVANSLLSLILKKMLNHERPTPALRSDPGMPSSHAQSIFYGATILDLSLFYWLGTNYLTMILAPAVLSVAIYLAALTSSPLLRNVVVLGSSAFVLGFGIYVIRNWLKDE